MSRFRRAGLAALSLFAGLGVIGYVASRSPRVLGAFFEYQVRSRLTQPLDKTDLLDDKALRVVLCGTSSPLPDQNRAKACTLVIAGGRIYVVDTGPELWKSLALMGIPGEHIAGIFLTHFHSDHFGDLGEFRLQTWVAGRRQPLSVYGGVGVERLTNGINEAYALDDRYRSAHHGPEVAPIEAAPLTPKPFRVGMSDTRDQSKILIDSDGLKVTAFDVNHEPVRPAIGYRFDYKGRSVVITGDTIKWPNVTEHAKGVDVLVHEAQSQGLRQKIADIARAAGNRSVGKIFDDIENYHASPVDAAEIANAARVKLLVFTHFTPPLPTSWLEPLFFEGVDAVRPNSGWVAGYDGLRIDLPAGGTDIRQIKMPIGILR